MMWLIAIYAAAYLPNYAILLHVIHTLCFVGPRQVGTYSTNEDGRTNGSPTQCCVGATIALHMKISYCLEAVMNGACATI